MSDEKQKPEWQKTLRRLLHSDEEVDRQELKLTLEKLRKKARALKVEIDAAVDEAARDALLEKWDILRKHRRKGLKKLLEL